MVRQAIKPHPKFKLLELVDISFSIERTLPKLQTLFAGDQLVFLMGSDNVEKMLLWPKIERLLKSSEIVVGVREGHNKYKVAEQISKWPLQPKQALILDSYAPNVSSSKVREALRGRKSEDGILTSVEKYSNQNWLYVSLA